MLCFVVWIPGFQNYLVWTPIFGIASNEMAVEVNFVSFMFVRSWIDESTRIVVVGMTEMTDELIDKTDLLLCF